MTNILVIKSSAKGAASVSNSLVDEVVARYPGAKVVEHDLDREPIPHITSRSLAAIGRTEPVTEAEIADRALSDHLVAELFAADLIVIGAPMYNFGLPTVLKSWFDRVLRSGVTFRYTAEGPEGLVKGKRVVVVSTRDGAYSEGPAVAMDGQEPHLRTMLIFMGLTDVTWVRAEGMAFGPEAREAAIAAARATIAGLDTTPWARAA